MTRRALPLVAAVLTLAIVVAGVPALGVALRTAFVLVSAAPVGGVLLLAIARLTGADWQVAGISARALPWLVPIAALVMLAPVGVPLPPHLALWSHPLFVTVRAAAATGALAFAGHRLHHGAGVTFAGVTLALYAALVTPLAADWLLPTAPGHPVSAIGMMLFLVQFAAGCAATLIAAAGRTRRDLALLLVAALLGLWYLAFMDYLIIWFGNLPRRVPFYLARSGALAAAGLLIGLAGTLAAVATARFRVAVVLAAAGLTLFALWWIGGGLLAGLAALGCTALLGGVMVRGTAHG